MSGVVKQIMSLFFSLPVTTQLFLKVVGGFLALALLVLIWRILRAIVMSIFGLNRRRGRLIKRPVPARLYSTDWALERERRMRELARRIKR
jgi:hypothetical protein